MEQYSREEILNIVEEEDVEFIRLQFTDMFGTMKNIAIPAGKLPKAMDDRCIIDASSIEGFIRTEESEMYLRPDLATFSILPWRPQQGKVARLICDLIRTDGTPYEGSPRYLLKEVLKKAESLGYTLKVNTECEFFLFHTDDNGIPTTITHERAGYLDLSPVDLGENARRDIVLTLEEMGYEVESSRHQIAPGQHEVEFCMDDALETADKIMTVKTAIRTIAKRHGLHATFMPKPYPGDNGSGMHCNQSIWKDGKNVFAGNGYAGLSETALYYIGGIIKHARALNAFTNPSTNSYKRLVPGFEAPVKLAYSACNRSAAIRIPKVFSEKGRRVEVRFPDPTANSYLAFSALLMAGLDGIQNKINPGDPADKNLYDLPPEENAKIPTVCSDLSEALAYLDQDREFLTRGGVFTNDLIDAYIAVKQEEVTTYRAAVHPLEYALYFAS